MGAYGSPEHLDFLNDRESKPIERNTTKKPAGCLKIILTSVVMFFAIIGAFMVFGMVFLGEMNTIPNSLKQVVGSEQEYIDSSIPLSYDELSENSSIYIGQRVRVTGGVAQVITSETNEQYIICNEKFVIPGYEHINAGWNFDKRIYVTYEKEKKSTDLIVNDSIVTVYGEFDGLEKLVSIHGTDIVMPKIKAKYIYVN